jgi:hypothetical protein
MTLAKIPTPATSTEKKKKKKAKEDRIGNSDF